MVRPRNLLMAWDISLSSKDASDILRRVDGDVEAAKRYITAEEDKINNESESKSKLNNSATTTTAERDKNENNRNKENNSKTTATAPTTPSSNSDPTSLLQGGKHQHQQQHQQQQQQDQQQQEPQQARVVARVPPSHITSINNLSDRQYCCVWSIEVYEDGYRPDVARTLLATVARHVNPILRERGWRCKRLIESASSKWIGLCTGNNRADADAASTNIQLNLRTQPDKHCTTFRSFNQILSVMLHEITHTSIGLEDIHPPAFYELLNEIKIQHKEKLLAGEVDLETDDYGCNGHYITSDSSVGSIASSAADLLLDHNDINNLDDMMNTPGSETECGASKKRGRGRRRNGGGSGGSGSRSIGGGGEKSKGYTSNVIKEKKRPLLKGAKLIDKRTKIGKEAMEEIANLTPRELAAKAAMARFSNSNSNSNGGGLRRTNGEGTGNKGIKMNSTGGRSGGETCIDDDNSSTDNESDDDNDDNDDEDERIVPHTQRCVCRSCDWSKIFLESTT